ncbi:MAG: S-methyl-5'-thioadenosine phosphorylase [Sphingosinicella sp.]
MSEWTIGIVGGSGLYEIEALEDAQWIEVETPWGAPSDALLNGRLHGHRFLFLPRHGRGHPLPPEALNARANIDALKRAGCTDLLAISAVGSLREEMAPGTFVAVEQFIDRTSGRTHSFFAPGLAAHVSLADPVCPRMTALAAAAAEAAGATVVRGATYVAIEGPQFSTRAESRLYREWGGDLVGMTASPEYRLAREAELPYALIGMVTDYDCWREGEQAEVAQILKHMHANAATARKLVVELAKSLPATREPCAIDRALDHAIITATDARDPQQVAKLDAVAGRVLRTQA